MLFIGDDWAEDHHDIEIEDADGRRLCKARLPEGLQGIAALHALVAQHAPPAWVDLDPHQVAGQALVGIETDRGPWVAGHAGRLAIRSSRSTRCRRRGIGNGIPLPELRVMPGMRMYWPRLCGLIVITTD